MTARRAKRTPTPKALRATPGGRAGATPKSQCRRRNAETRGRRAPPRTGRGDSPSTGPASPSAATPPQGQRRSAGKNFRRRRFATLAHTPRRPQAAGATPSRRASMRRGPGSVFSKSRPPEASTHESGRVSSGRQRPGLSRHAGGGSTSREQFAATFPRVPLLYCQSNMVVSRSGLGNRPL